VSPTPEDLNGRNAQSIAAAVTEVSERATLLVRDEIELAKAEITEKVTKLVKGAIVAAAAGVFVVIALLFALHGLAWFVWYELPTSGPTYFWGFFIVAAGLLLLGVIAGFVAAKAVKAGAPPTPKMAIDEARKIRETVSGASGEGGS
jgi:uncharacterized membrane protein YqjE